MADDAEESPPLGEVFAEAFKDADDRITDLHYSAIGRVAASWAYFEAVIDTMTAHLMDVTVEIGTCVLSQAPGLRRLDAFIALAKYRNAKVKDIGKLDEIAKRAAVLGQRRNRALHDVWDLSNPEEPLRREATARRKLRFMSIPVSTQELLDVVKDIYDMSWQFLDIAGAIFNQIHSMPEATGVRRPFETSPVGA
jgi:hypothetical protein